MPLVIRLQTWPWSYSSRAYELVPDQLEIAGGRLGRAPGLADPDHPVLGLDLDQRGAAARDQTARHAVRLGRRHVVGERDQTDVADAGHAGVSLVRTARQASRKPGLPLLSFRRVRRCREELPMAPSQSDKARSLPGAARAAGRFRHAQSVGRRHGAHPDGARLRGARDHQRRSGVRARTPRRRRRAEPRRRSRECRRHRAARRRCRSRRTWRTASAPRRRRRPRPSVWRPLPVWSAPRSRTPRAIPTARSTTPRSRRSASRRRPRLPARSPSRSRSPRAPRTSSMADPISTTPSAGCRRSRPRAPTCSTRRGCAI